MDMCDHAAWSTPEIVMDSKVMPTAWAWLQENLEDCWWFEPVLVASKTCLTGRIHMQADHVAVISAFLMAWWPSITQAQRDNTGYCHIRNVEIVTYPGDAFWDMRHQDLQPGLVLECCNLLYNNIDMNYLPWHAHTHHYCQPRIDFSSMEH